MLPRNAAAAVVRRRRNRCYFLSIRFAYRHILMRLLLTGLDCCANTLGDEQGHKVMNSRVLRELGPRVSVELGNRLGRSIGLGRNCLYNLAGISRCHSALAPHKL